MISVRSIGACALCLALAACGRANRPAPPAPSANPAASAALGSPAAAAATPAGASLITDSADGVHIEYRVYGHGDPAIVLIHGWAANAGFWREQIAPLAAKYTTVTLNLAGHGGSGRNRTDWSMARFGQDVAAVVRELPNRRIILVGHSMGGPVALEAAPLIGARLVGIIGIDTFRSIGLPPPAKQALEKQIAPFRTDYFGAMQRLVPQLFTRRADPRFVHLVAAEMARVPPQVAIGALESLNTLDYAPLLARIHVPIVAMDSDLQAPPDVNRVRRVVPDFSLVVFPGDGTFLTLEDPRRLNPMLLAKIAWLAGEPEPGSGARRAMLGDPAAARSEGPTGHVHAAE